VSVEQFFHMGGYAGYVWPSYALTLVLVVVNWVVPIRREHRLLREIRRRLRRRRK
jgi:heme exporter protein D